MLTPFGGIPASGDNALSHEMIGCAAEVSGKISFKPVKPVSCPSGASVNSMERPSIRAYWLANDGVDGSTASLSDDALDFSNVARRWTLPVAGAEAADAPSTSSLTSKWIA